MATFSGVVKYKLQEGSTRVLVIENGSPPPDEYVYMHFDPESLFDSVEETDAVVGEDDGGDPPTLIALQKVT